MSSDLTTLHVKQNKQRLENAWFYLGGSGLDQIQFFRIRTGLGLKNFTVCQR